MMLVKVFGILLFMFVNFAQAIELEGDIRSAYMDYNFDNYFPNSRALAVSGRLGIKADLGHGFFSGAKFATVQGLGLNKKDEQYMTFTFNKNQESFTLLQELYVGFMNSSTKIKLGRQQMNTPLIDSDDYFVIGNSFEAFTLEHKYSNNIKFHLGYVQAMSGWDSSFDIGSFESMSKQAWTHKADSGVDGYYDVSSYIGNRGVSFLGGLYANETLNFQVWNYVAHDMFNALFFQGDFVVNENINISIQYQSRKEIGKMKNIKSVGSNLHIDYSTWSAQASILVKNMKVSAKYTGISDDESLHFFGAWGGYSEFASGIMVNYFETSLRDANIYTLQNDLDLSAVVSGLNLTLNYSYYDLNQDYTKSIFAPKGEAYLHAYGATVVYNFLPNTLFAIEAGVRKLDNGSNSNRFRTLLAYYF